MPAPNKPKGRPARGPRSIDECFASARKELDLAAEDIPEAYWVAVRELHKIGGQQVLGICCRLMMSTHPEDRIIAYDVAGQSFRKEEELQSAALKAMLSAGEHEKDSKVLSSLICALGHLWEPAATPFVLRFVGHPDSDVRFDVAFALSTPAGDEESMEVLRALVRLSQDSDAEVRNWATFGLGTQYSSDTPEIRNALKARLEDEDEEVSDEALVGLARRRDPIAIPTVKKRLESGDDTSLVLDAAELCADPSLLPLLEELDPGTDAAHREVLESAIKACRKQSA